MKRLRLTLDLIDAITGFIRAVTAFFGWGEDPPEEEEDWDDDDGEEEEEPEEPEEERARPKKRRTRRVPKRTVKRR